jgi:phage major head subunit gpT-like protein
MLINSSSNAENYGWLKDLPGMREWVGQRVILNLETTAAKLVNKTYEHTVGVNRQDIEDDTLGLYSTIFQQQGEIVARHPDDLVWGLLPQGFTVAGFDGQPFFDADHAGFSRNKAEVSWSNVQTGSGKPWFVADLSRNFMKPLIFQMRKAPQFVSKTRADDDHVFMQGEYLYGVDARYNAGFGFHQLIVGSQAALDADSYEAARLALAGQFRPDGSPLPVRATHVIVGESNRLAAARILNQEFLAGGESNINRGTAQIIVSPWLE